MKTKKNILQKKIDENWGMIVYHKLNDKSEFKRVALTDIYCKYNYNNTLLIYLFRTHIDDN